MLRPISYLRRYVLVKPNRALIAHYGRKGLTLSRLGPRLDHVLSLAIHISPNNGPINMVSLAKLIHYVLPLHIACLIIQIGPLGAKLQHVTGMRGG